MKQQKRATIYLDSELRTALRLKAAATGRSISAMVNEAVQIALADDADDISAFDARKAEQSVSFERFVRGLKRRELV